MKRTVKSEILDRLPETHPDALHSRRDLRLINAIMGNFRWFTRGLKQLLCQQDRILEIGSGDGSMGQCLHRKLSRRNASLTVTGLDLCQQPMYWPACWPWVQQDWRLFATLEEYGIILGNMILHHFEDDELHRLGQRLQHRARALLFSEPARCILHQHQITWAKLLGINYVTFHDARVSIQAGFRGQELPRLLGLDPKTWHWRCTHGFFGQYRMVAVRHTI